MYISGIATAFGNLIVLLPSHWEEAELNVAEKNLVFKVRYVFLNLSERKGLNSFIISQLLFIELLLIARQ